MIFAGVSLAILVTMVLAVIRALRGPTVYDRLLAVNMFGTKTALLLAVAAFLLNREDFLDLALAYALINLVGIIAVLEFFENRSDKPQEACPREHQSHRKAAEDPDGHHDKHGNREDLIHHCAGRLFVPVHLAHVSLSERRCCEGLQSSRQEPARSGR